jgi:multicomponent Na+:H+ antiporter subunit D
MRWVYHVPAIMILFPMVVAVILPLLRNTRVTKAVTVLVQFSLSVLSLCLLKELWGAPVEYFNYSMGHFPAPWGNELRAGPLEAMLACAFTAVMMFSLTGGSYDITKDINEKKVYLYSVMINLLTSSLMALVFTNDIFTAYVFIEINTIAACAIVVSKENGETLKATVKYLFLSVLGSGLFLLSTSILYDITGHLLMEPAHQAVVALVAEGRYQLPLLVTLLLYIVAVAVKSALFPFHAWLPDAHGYATTTSSAVLSGLVLKGYIVLLIKLVFRVYGFEVVSILGALPSLFALGLASMIFGSVLAFTQKDIKRMIAYSSVAQIGYIFMGIGLNNAAGFTASCYHIIAHAFTKSMLFIAAGALINAAGSKNISDMVGAGRENKIAGLAFAVGAMSMIGVPLFAGFPSKFYLANAAMQGQYGTWIALIVLALSTFLNALYFVPTVTRIYSAGDKKESKVKLAAPSGDGVRFVAARTLICLMVANIALGVFHVPMLSVIEIGFSRLG